MSNRFSGAERGGDRRRRRLATQADVGADGAPTDAPDPVASPYRYRTELRFDSPATLPTAPRLPLETLVPLAWWKYALAGGSLALLIGGLSWATWRGTELVQRLGPGIEGLLFAESTPLATTLGSLLLYVAALYAWLTGWGRSLSASDFTGTYRRWYRVAICTFLLGAAQQLRLQHVLVDTVVHFVPRDVWRRETILWLLPAVIVAAACGGAVRREVARSRGSTSMLLLAVAWYFLATLLQLELESRVEPEVRRVLVQMLVLLGHGTLALCFWIHARFVLYFNPDPVEPAPRSASQVRPTWKFLTRWLSRRPVPAEAGVNPETAESEPDGESDDESATPARKKKAARRSTRKVPASRARPRHWAEPAPLQEESPADESPVEDEGESEGDQETALREESATENAGTHADRHAAREWEDAAPVEPGHVPTAAPGNLTPVEWESVEEPSAVQRAGNPAPREDAGIAPREIEEHSTFQRLDAGESRREFDDGEGEESSSEGGLHLKGLSKKERRRLKQQQRERERQSQRH